MTSPCPKCDRVHIAGSVTVASGRFTPGAKYYRHYRSPRLFTTREEAEADLCAIYASLRSADSATRPSGVGASPSPDPPSG